MLKRLELLGFKSFADKTAFEFGAGITGIVGPNGSGKSNVVDAIKWVLGEQSAKSLRGKEMADVIFNGSATRRSLGYAEATLVFDNSRRLLPVDAGEVQLTRRVYRSGEGEYLINKNPARLRDFRDLFMGTGAGADAYCVIEQGKVDILLQSSTKDRRVIFEEAAGISRFKARKIESLRKLEHVAQNLLRLNDIVEEVEKQLRSVKLQAAKARRHQEYSERLRELRLSLGLEDFHEYSHRLSEIEEKIRRLVAEVQEQSTRCDAIDAKLVQVQSLAEDLDSQIHALELAQADCRQDIARLESQVGYERAHARDLLVQIDRLRGQWAEFSRRVAELDRHVATLGIDVDRLEGQCAARRSEVEAESKIVDELRAAAAAGERQVAADQDQLMDLAQAANGLHNQLAAMASQERTLRAQHERISSRCDSLEGPIAEVSAQIEALMGQEHTTTQDRDQVRLAMEQADDQLESLWLSQQELASSIAGLRESRSAIGARAKTLADLERRLEGVRNGVQHVLASEEFARYRVGLVADLLHVDVSNAACIDRALGERAQAIVVHRQADLAAHLGRPDTTLPGSVMFLPLDCIPSEGDEDSAGETVQHDGMLGYADALVRPAVGCERLAASLLGRTLIVQDLQVALAIARKCPGRFRFVTASGDVLEPDGSIISGGRDAGDGLVSRKSELRALEQESQSLDARIAAHEKELSEIQQTQARVKHERAMLEGRLASVSDQAVRLANLLSQRRQQRTSLADELSSHRAELGAIDRDRSELLVQQEQVQQQVLCNVAERESLEQSIHEREREVERSLAGVEQCQESLTADKIELAKTEGQLAGLRQRLAALTADLDDRRRVQAETRQQIDAAVEREQSCQRKTLVATSHLAGLYLRKEVVGKEASGLVQRRDEFRQSRHELSTESHTARERLKRVQADLHQHQLDASEIRHQRSTLQERIREDYGTDLASLYGDFVPDPTRDRAAAQQEIGELRRKIAALGNVNLEALAELEELETRSTTLRAQIDDLNQSKATLDEIIRKINQDSQRLFLETLEAVRSHFGELFRKLFGGGRADILLENEADVLESGIEIVARPPGKELRSLSLLSGGEKTLTTVALLMAVFRAKPSPFCILDEVDAALDEANIERYTTMLREFSSQAQFIMITHSKKSMGCVDVLYGITMQESGVSKRVSVRFEDVGEQGEISEAAIERNEAPPPNEQEAA